MIILKITVFWSSAEPHYLCNYCVHFLCSTALQHCLLQSYKKKQKKKPHNRRIYGNGFKERKYQRIAQIKGGGKWRRSCSSVRLLAIRDVHHSVESRVQPPPWIRYYIHPRCPTDPGVWVWPLSRALTPGPLIDLRKQCGTLGYSGPICLLRWTRTRRRQRDSAARPGEHGVSHDILVMTEHAKMTRHSNEGHPSGTIRAVTSASLIVLHSVPEQLGCFVPNFIFLFFIITV